MLGVILSEWGLGVFVQGIQITATTPTSSAVRLETGSVDLEVSNRVLMATDESKQKGQDTGMFIEHYFSIVYCELRPMITFHYSNFTVLMNIVYFLYHRIYRYALFIFSFFVAPKVNEKMFIKAHVNLNLALGQLIKVRGYSSAYQMNH